MLLYSKQKIYKTTKQAVLTILLSLKMNEDGTVRIRYNALTNDILYTTSYTDLLTTVWYSLTASGGSLDSDKYYTKALVLLLIDKAISSATPATKVLTVDVRPDTGTLGVIYLMTDGTLFIYHDGKWYQLGPDAYTTYLVL